jgi:uncharacterized protein|tara:strand:- start:10244 stop:10639 length:396 start_codon:yes stop_codon:yes gene_type:complete
MSALQGSSALHGSNEVKQLIESYGGGGFQVAGKRYQGSQILVLGEVLDWPVADLDEATAQNLRPLLNKAGDLELVLLGCGEKNRMLPPALSALFRDAGVALEGMDSANAVKTFNLLANEGRKVAAALIAQP